MRESNSRIGRNIYFVIPPEPLHFSRHLIKSPRAAFARACSRSAQLRLRSAQDRLNCSPRVLRSAPVCSGALCLASRANQDIFELPSVMPIKAVVPYGSPGFKGNCLSCSSLPWSSPAKPVYGLLFPLLKAGRCTLKLPHAAKPIQAVIYIDVSLVLKSHVYFSDNEPSLF